MNSFDGKMSLSLLKAKLERAEQGEGRGGGDEEGGEGQLRQRREWLESRLEGQGVVMVAEQGRGGEWGREGGVVQLTWQGVWDSGLEGCPRGTWW